MTCSFAVIMMGYGFLCSTELVQHPASSNFSVALSGYFTDDLLFLHSSSNYEQAAVFRLRGIPVYINTRIEAFFFL